MADSSGQQLVGLGGVEVLGGLEEKERRGACCEGWEEEVAVRVGQLHRGCVCHACSHMGCHG